MTIEINLIREQYRSTINGRTYVRTRAAFPDEVWRVKGGSFRIEGTKLILIPKG